jgi:ATP-dependent Clp protease ATP-binding subunit ClpX
VTTVDDLDKDALIKILVEPRNALVKQYAKFFEMDGVELVFTDDALDAVADLALLRSTGARGLRAILEEVLLNTMYELPSRSDVAQVRLDADVVRERVNPTLVPIHDLGKDTPTERSA